jgi:ornithine cyclodeaminase/alanine dehydrogenase-like protein (mu-crystallin family)
MIEPLEKNLIQLEKIRELAELATRVFSGRTSDEQITYHKNNNGLGCADLAIAMRAYELAKQAGRGITIDLPAPGTQ